MSSLTSDPQMANAKDVHANPWPTFALASLGMFLVSLDATIGFAALPSLRISFNSASTADLSWVLTAYSIVYAALLVPAGRLADLLGRKRVFLIGMLAFTGASALCAIASGLEFLITARALQALGAALLTPTSLALILQAFPKERRAVGVGLWGAVGGLAGALGPSAGAAIIQFASWQWAFGLNVPIGLLAWASARVRLTESRSVQTGQRIDVIGVTLLISSVGLLTLGLVQSGDWGWTSIRTQATLVTGALALFVCVRWAWKRPNAALDLSLFDGANYIFVSLATFSFGVAFTAMFVGFFLFLTAVWHYNIMQAGLAIAIGPLLVVPVAMLSGRYASRHGHKSALLLGGIIYATCGGWFYLHAAAEPNYLRAWLPGMLLSGLGVGLLMPALSASAVTALPPERFGIGSATNTAIRNLGSALGVALTVMLIGAEKVSSNHEPFAHVFLLLAIGSLLTSILCLPLRYEKAANPATSTNQSTK